MSEQMNEQQNRKSVGNTERCAESRTEREVDQMSTLGKPEDHQASQIESELT